jgi:hypothetical protein
MKRYFSQSVAASFVSAICLMISPVGASVTDKDNMPHWLRKTGIVTVKNDNIPQEDVNSRDARLVFETSGTQEFAWLPSTGETIEDYYNHGLKGNAWRMIFLTTPGDQFGVLCKKDNVPFDFLCKEDSVELRDFHLTNNQVLKITVGYLEPVSEKKGYCKAEVKELT